MGSDKLFFKCLNDYNIIKIKTIKNYLDLFINTSLTHMSIRSSIVSQPRNKLISNSKQLFNATDSSPITVGVILPPNRRCKISTNSQISPRTLEYVLSKYY